MPPLIFCTSTNADVYALLGSSMQPDLCMPSSSFSISSLNAQGIILVKHVDTGGAPLNVPLPLPQYWSHIRMYIGPYQ